MPDDGRRDALIRQYLTDGWYPTGAPSPANALHAERALLKAMAINSTDNDMTGFTDRRTTTSAGAASSSTTSSSSRATRARSALVDDNDGLATGEFVEYQFNVDRHLGAAQDHAVLDGQGRQSAAPPCSS